MRIQIFALAVILLCNVSSAQALSFNTSQDERAKEAKYILKVKKEEEKENYNKKKFFYSKSGFMTVDEYEELSKYKDKTQEKSEIPKPVKPADMKYVPQPTYRIVRYNDPPGSPELNMTKNFYKLKQYNGQGITAPDYSIMAYPVVYYYANSVSCASDIFVIPLENIGTPLSKIMKANVKNRLPDPIISTEKAIDNSFAFRTLTPIDFSKDATKLLVKEKLGSSEDGIWKTSMIVYDFENKTSYELVELRDAIVYYWKENKGINLEELRWDIIPLGFLKDDNTRVVACAYAYTGGKPIFLGTWSVDVRGEQSRLISFKLSDVEISANGFKIIQDGVVKPVIVKDEEKAQKRAAKIDKKTAKTKEKQDLKEMKTEYKQKIKELEAEYKEGAHDFKKLESLKGTTSLNDMPEHFKELKIKELEQVIKREEKNLQREQREIEKLDNLINKLK